MTDFKDKIVLITGGSRGLGRSMALGFARKGAHIAIVSRKLEVCEQVAGEVKALGVNAFPYSCHVGHWQELDEMVEAVYSRFGRVDVLINNAGMSPLYPSLDAVTEELFDKVVGVNLKGPFRLSANVGKRMVEEGSGCIIKIPAQTRSRMAPPRQVLMPLHDRSPVPWDQKSG